MEMTSQDPYHPPKTDSIPDLGDQVDAVKLYSMGQVIWATFLGSIVAGVFLIYKNTQNKYPLASKTPIKLILVLSIIFIIGASLFLPLAVPGLLFIIFQILVVRYIYEFYEKQYPKKSNQTKAEISSWYASGWGLVFAAVIFISTMLFFYLIPEEWEKYFLA